MAVAVYTTDLATLNLSTGTWVELDGAAAGSAPTENDIDNFIAGIDSTTEAVRNSGLSSMSAPANTQTITSGDAVFMWLYFSAMESMDTFANGGYRVAIGHADSDYKMWNVFGKDTKKYGGWISVAVDPAQTASSSYGTPTAVTTYFGSVINLTGGISKGNAFANDYQRHGRSLICTAGDSGTPATFADASQENDYNDVTNGYNRWGLFATIDAGYSQKGLFQMGSASTAVYFEDTNVNIIIEDTFHCAAGFNEYEILNTGSTVLWTGVQISALGSQAPGVFSVTDNATVTFVGCTFNDMGAFTFNDGTNPNSITGTTFRRCGLVTQGGAVLDDCTFDSTSATSALSTDNLDDVDNCNFTSDGSSHAIYIPSGSTGTFDLTGHTFTDYATSDGSTGNEVIYNDSGGAVTLNASGVTGAISVRNGTSASTTIVNSVPLEVNGVKTGTEPTNYARCRIEKTSDGTQIMNEEAQTSYGSDGFYKATESYGFTTDVAVTIIARYRGYLPFKTTGIITSAGLTVTAVWVIDPNYI